MSKLVVRFVLFACVLVALLSATTGPVFARALEDGGTVKRACTVNDNWWTKLWDPCTEVDPHVSTPGVYDQPMVFDVDKWEQALADAEAWLRANNTGNNYPVDNSAISRQAWKLYCLSNAEPQYDINGRPVCGQ